MRKLVWAILTVLCLSVGVSAAGADHVYEEAVPGGTVTVVLPDALTDRVTKDELREILEEQEVGDGCTLNIHHVEDLNTGDRPAIEAEYPYLYSMRRLEVGGEYALYDLFLNSQAKGMTTTVTGGPLIPAGTVFTGPPEDSDANSRSYYVRFYGREDVWVLEWYLYTRLAWREVRSVFCQTRAVVYSIDQYISH